MLATLEALKRYIGISQGYFGEDKRLESLLSAASAGIEEHCGRSFTLMETVDYLDGAGTPELVLSRRPVTELYSVCVDRDRDFDVDTELGRAEIILYPNSGIIERVGSVFPTGAVNVQVSYAAGYTVIPEDLALACVQLAAQLYLVSDLSAETEALVSPYRNREPK